MDPRRLVGMTQGARKRAAMAHSIDFAERASDEPQCHWLIFYAFARWSYRVGQRLRLCRGCNNCKFAVPDRPQSFWVAREWRAIRAVMAIMPTCDSSGVVVLP
jgi:hypothetical protein